VCLCVHTNSQSGNLQSKRQQSKEKAIYFSFPSATQRLIRIEYVKAAAYKQVAFVSKKEMTIVYRPVTLRGQDASEPSASWTSRFEKLAVVNINRDCGHLECDAVESSNYIPTFRVELSPTSSGLFIYPED
jgi:hypothetical protein